MEIAPKPQNQLNKSVARNVAAMVLTIVGLCAVAGGVATITIASTRVTVGVVALGVVVIVLSVLHLVRAGRLASRLEEVDRALRAPGTVELLTVKTSVERDSDLPDKLVLAANLLVELDSGDTIRGRYRAYFRVDSPHAAKFVVGARLRCLVNPENGWKVWVPLLGPGDEMPAPGADLSQGGRAACFYSAT